VGVASDEAAEGVAGYAEAREEAGEGAGAVPESGGECLELCGHGGDRGARIGAQYHACSLRR